MKNYFKFNLKGTKLFPIWLLLLLLCGVPYVFILTKVSSIQPAANGGVSSPYLTLSLFLLILVAYTIVFFFIKLIIEGVEYKEKSLVFGGSFGRFLLVYLGGILLSIITLGIYTPWFIRNMMRFFVDKTSCESNNFEFQGKGGKLFLILLLTLFIPMMVLMVVMILFSTKNAYQVSQTATIIQQLIMMVIMIPYIYSVYKWMADVKYKNYSIRWETNFWKACGNIALQLLLTIITIGIYYPLAYLKLYQYFAERTVATSDEGIKKIGYDLEPKADFLFIWGQLLLTIITLSIYYPWAFCKVTNRVLGKTFSEEVEVQS